MQRGQTTPDTITKYPLHPKAFCEALSMKVHLSPLICCRIRGIQRKKVKSAFDVHVQVAETSPTRRICPVPGAELSPCTTTSGTTATEIKQMGRIGEKNERECGKKCVSVILVLGNLLWLEPEPLKSWSSPQRCKTDFSFCLLTGNRFGLDVCLSNLLKICFIYFYMHQKAQK